MRWKPSKYNVLAEFDGSTLIFNTATSNIWKLPPEGKAEKILREGADHLESGYEEFPSLGFLVPEEENEEELVKDQLESRIFPDDTLELTILPTDQCNFRCEYCYETFSEEEMGEEAMEGIKTVVKERGEKLSKLNISWFGGEPLLALDVIRDLSSFFIQASKEYDLTYTAGMTTNGYLLTKEVAKELIGLGVNSFQVTLDGPAEQHNKKRKLVNGKGTYKRIYNNLLDLRNSDLSYRMLVRMNYDRDNYEEIFDFLDSDELAKLKDDRFYLGFRPVGKWGGPNDEALNVCPTGQGEQLMVDFDRAALKRGFNSLDVFNLQPGGFICYASKPNSYVIGHEGAVYKCTVGLDDDRNLVGNLSSDGIDFREEQLNLWYRHWSDLEEECLDCPVLPLCGGNSCPMSRIKQGDNLCPMPKRFIEEMIKNMWIFQSTEGKSRLFSTVK